LVYRILNSHNFTCAFDEGRRSSKILKHYSCCCSKLASVSLEKSRTWQHILDEDNEIITLWLASTIPKLGYPYILESYLASLGTNANANPWGSTPFDHSGWETAKRARVLCSLRLFKYRMPWPSSANRDSSEDFYVYYTLHRLYHRFLIFWLQ